MASKASHDLSFTFCYIAKSLFPEKQIADGIEDPAYNKNSASDRLIKEQLTRHL